jgi:hypothetical protein
MAMPTNAALPLARSEPRTRTLEHGNLMAQGDRFQQQRGLELAP